MSKAKRKPERYWFGHPVYTDFDGQDDFERFCDTDESVTADSLDLRACPTCGLRRTVEGHDPCLGALPGVSYACCGHGREDGYIRFENGTTVRGNFTKVERPPILIARRSLKGARAS